MTFDSFEKTQGTISYLCGWQDYSVLANLGVPVPPQSQGTWFQVYVRSNNPDVAAFVVIVDGEAKIATANPNREMQTIVGFQMEKREIESVQVEALVIVETLDL